MHLKKLELLGFKSFADRTVFEFKPGITGIVGPNGCGKSNVVDAFKWILGSQSAKGLRGTEMKDVIFSGTQSRKPQGFAEVTVVFDNEDRFLDVDYSEVAITRRLFQSGESEYLINKQKCRLKDIKDLLLDTGFGTTSYSILEQGKIDVLLQASTADRRVIFEEAAGISKYRVRKAESLRSLLRVEENLSRLQDIIDEVEKRIRRLRAQASKARRYRAASEKLKELRVRLALEDYRASVEGRAGISFELYWVGERIQRFERIARRLASRLEAEMEARRALLATLDSLRERLASERVERERTEERIAQMARRLMELREEETRKARDLEETRGVLAHLDEGLRAARRELEALSGEISRHRALLDEAGARLSGTQGEHSQLREELERRKQAVVGLLAERSRAANQVVQVAAELGNLKGRRERLEAAIARHGEGLEECRQRAELLDRTLEDAVRERQQLETGRRELERETGDLQREIDAVEGELRARREELHRKSSRYEVLRSFEERLDGVASGARAVLRKRDELPGAAQVRGLVASLVRVDRKYARAVEAALGERAQALAVETQEGALELLESVRDGELGGLETICLDRVDAPGQERFARQGGVLGPLRDFVRPEPGMEDAVERLLAGVVLVEDFPTALALSRNGLASFRLVTLEGELVLPWGGLSVPGRNEAGIISRQSEMDELLVDVARVEEQSRRLEERLDSLRQGLERARDGMRAHGARVEEAERRKLTIEGERAQVAREADRLERELEVGRSEVEDVEADIRRRAEEEVARQGEVDRLDRERVATEEGIAALEGRLEEARARMESAQEAVGRIRVELAQHEKQEEGQLRLVEEQRSNLGARTRHADELDASIRSVRERIAEAEREEARARQALEQVSEREAQTAAELEAEEARDRGLRETEDRFRKAIDAVRDRASALSREREMLQLRDQEERHRRNTLLERIDEEYGLDLKGLAEHAGAGPAQDACGTAGPAAGAYAEVDGNETVPAADAATDSGAAGLEDAEGDEENFLDSSELLDAVEQGEERYFKPIAPEERDAAQQEIRSLQERIRRLGNVNLEALDELRELVERFRFQLEQKKDLVESERNLRGIIAEINTKSRRLFQETFEAVQGHFNELFRKCFGGGRAELVLEEGVDILDAGIEIVARPPGKKLTSLSLMSGGERTMTTIALLLAIFRSRPSPFCILDEVDAPLDEANVRRFVVLLRDFLDSSQFVIITHNKVTMGEAGTLYGVTMQERGVSKRVAVELESYDPDTVGAAQPIPLLSGESTQA